MDNIWIQSLITFGLGLLAFAVTQLLTIFILKPVQELRSAIAEAYEQMTYSSNKYTNPLVREDEHSEYTLSIYRESSGALRRCAAKLISKTFMIPAYDSVSVIFRLPSREQMNHSIKSLYFLQNMHWVGKREEDALEKIDNAEKQFYQSIGREKIKI